MKKVFCFIVAVCVCCMSIMAVADYAPSYSGEENKREYKYEGEGIFSHLVLQEGDLAENVFCQTIREIIKEDVSVESGEKIEEVSFDNAVLHIVVSWIPGYLEDKYVTDVDVARMICCYITDDILKFEELDQYWEKIVFTYINGEAVFTKDMIVNSEYGRYFDGVDDIIK